MSTDTRLRISVSYCGCLVEQPRPSEMIWFRCDRHVDRMVRIKASYTPRRCESCRRRPAVVRVWFAGGANWRVCRWCEPWTDRRVL